MRKVSIPAAGRAQLLKAVPTFIYEGVSRETPARFIIVSLSRVDTSDNIHSDITQPQFPQWVYSVLTLLNKNSYLLNIC